MSEERAGPQPVEADELDQLLDDDVEGEEPGEGEELDLGDDADADGGDEEPPEQTQPQRPQPSRAERRIRSLSQEVKELRSLLTRQPAAPPPYQPPQPDPLRQAQIEQQERENFLLMDPFQQQQYTERRLSDRFQREILMTRLQGADLLDKQAFDNLARADPVARKFKDQVESTLITERTQGRNPSREEILDRMIGAEVRAKHARASDQQRVRGRRRIASQTTRPSGTRSTAAVQGGRRNQNQDADDDALLRGITVGEFLQGA